MNKKLNIGIDVDDTITDSFDYLLPYVAEFYNIDISYLKNNNISYSNLTKEMKEKELDLAKKYYDKVIGNAPIKKDAAKYIKKLKELGHKIYIITARTDIVYKDPYKLTEDYLKKHDVPFDKIICIYDKVKACKENHIDILIDDLEKNCELAHSNNINVLMFASKSNINVSKFEKANNWEEVYQYLIKSSEK